MARFFRLEVLNAIVESGFVPLFYHRDAEVAQRIASAVAAGGSRLLEFTNRGDFAPQVFSQLSRYLAENHPEVILGVGSIMDAPTAAMYLAQGANFIVGPLLNPEVARLCNRRKVAYCPGAATPREIAEAEELGAEIVKIFPGEAVGGPGFVKNVLGPSPWSRLMPTSGIEPTPESLRAWFQAGVCAVGIGSSLVQKDWVAAGNYEAITKLVAEVLGWIREARQ